MTAAEEPLSSPTSPPMPGGTVAMLAHPRLNGTLIRSLTAELARRGTVHHTEATTFSTKGAAVEGPVEDTVQAVRWFVSLTDSDDDFGTQLVDSLLQDAADQHGEPGTVTHTVVPAHHRPRSPMMLIMDVDSTLIDQEVIDLLASHANREAEVAAVTERAMRGELDFTASLHQRVEALRGLPLTVLEDTLETITVTCGAEELIAAFRVNQAPAFAVSGGFNHILQPLARRLGLTGSEANTLTIEDGQLTGAVEGQIVDRAYKRDALLRWAEQYGVAAQNVVAVGDGANDLDMVKAAGIGVAFCAKPALADQADLVIAHRNLGLVGWALGLPRNSPR